MANKEEMVKAFLEAATADKELLAKMQAAVEAKDSEAVAALAAEKGFDLVADDFPFPTAEELAGAELDEKELGAVAGGLGGTFEWIQDCSWYAATACGLAAGGFFWMGDTDYGTR